MRVTRRGLQLALAGMWLLDAALQFQPYMFSAAFGREVIGPTGAGQPWIVAAPGHLAAHLSSAHPIATNTAFALVQLALAVGLLVRRTARVALLASVGWSLAVWWLGEGLGGLLSGHAMLLTGAPGAVILYALVAVAACPARGRDGCGDIPSPAAVIGWVATWTVGGILQTLPGQNRPGDIAAALRDNADNVPGWLSHPTRSLATSVDHHGMIVLALIVLPLLIAAAATVPGATRTASTVAGAVLAGGFWMFGQGFGLLFSGQSTDPNSGPLLLLLAVATAAATTHRAGSTAVAPRRVRHEHASTPTPLVRAA